MPKDYLFTSESVTEGHPDKIADQISDALLDAIIKDDPRARVAIETCLKTGFALVAGEVTTRTYIDIPKIIRRTICRIGYTDSSHGFDGNTCAVLASIEGQSGDISLGVTAETSESKEQGAGDQGMMFGFAVDETAELMPAPISWAHKLTRQLSAARRSSLPYLRPDGKSQVTIQYENNKPKRIDAVVISSQHADSVSTEQIRKDIREQVIDAVLPKHLVDNNTKYFINPTGRFVIGGPMGDAGVTGRKIIVDTYGGMGRHGGGAFSGKDPSKVDRSAAYVARWLAKNVVAAGLARRAEVQVAYAIGVAGPVSVLVGTFGTAVVDEEKIAKAVRATFGLKPAQIVEQLDLLRPIYEKTAAYGHFGRSEPEFKWESTAKAAELRDAAGLKGEPAPIGQQAHA